MIEVSNGERGWRRRKDYEVKREPHLTPQQFEEKYGTEPLNLPPGSMITSWKETEEGYDIKYRYTVEPTPPVYPTPRGPYEDRGVDVAREYPHALVWDDTGKPLTSQEMKAYRTARPGEYQAYVQSYQIPHAGPLETRKREAERWGKAERVDLTGLEFAEKYKTEPITGLPTGAKITHVLETPQGFEFQYKTPTGKRGTIREAMLETGWHPLAAEFVGAGESMLGSLLSVVGIKTPAGEQPTGLGMAGVYSALGGPFGPVAPAYREEVLQELKERPWAIPGELAFDVALMLGFTKLADKVYGMAKKKWTLEKLSSVGEYEVQKVSPKEYSLQRISELSTTKTGISKQDAKFIKDLLKHTEIKQLELGGKQIGVVTFGDTRLVGKGATLSLRPADPFLQALKTESKTALGIYTIKPAIGKLTTATVKFQAVRQYTATAWFGIIDPKYLAKLLGKATTTVVGGGMTKLTSHQASQYLTRLPAFVGVSSGPAISRVGSFIGIGAGMASRIKDLSGTLPRYRERVSRAFQPKERERERTAVTQAQITKSSHDLGLALTTITGVGKLEEVRYPKIRPPSFKLKLPTLRKYRRRFGKGAWFEKRHPLATHKQIANMVLGGIRKPRKQKKRKKARRTTRRKTRARDPLRDFNKKMKRLVI